MKTVWKYVLLLTDNQTIRVPAGAIVLTVARQGAPLFADNLCLWALVDPDQPREDLAVWIRGTGHPADDIPESARYIGTVLLRSDTLVLHVWVGS